MKTLHLLRHAKSSWDDQSLADHDRPLARRGEKAADLVAAHMARRRIGVDLVLCSSATRARQTLERVIPALGANAKTFVEDELYSADADDLLSRLRQIDDAVQSVLVIGHNPALAELTTELVDDGDAGALGELRRKFPTGALATVTTRTTWSGLERGLGYLESFVMPRRLKAA